MKKRLIGAAMVLALAGPGLATAQDNHDWRGREAPARPARPAPAARPQGAPGGWNRGGAPQARSWQGRPAGGWNGGWRGQTQGAAPAQAAPNRWSGQAAPNRWTGQARGAWQGAPNREAWTGAQGWRGGQAWRGEGFAREGARPFSYRGRTFYRYRVEPYRWPGGYAYRYAWRRGEYLPRVFFLEDYFLPDFYDFGLWAPPPGAEWIRVGDDAVLVDLYSGEIIDVVPGVFYWD